MLGTFIFYSENLYGPTQRRPFLVKMYRFSSRFTNVDRQGRVRDKSSLKGRTKICQCFHLPKYHGSNCKISSKSPVALFQTWWWISTSFRRSNFTCHSLSKKQTGKSDLHCRQKCPI